MILARDSIILAFISSLLVYGACEAVEPTTNPISKFPDPPNVHEARTRAFSVYDTDQDGVLSKSEYDHFIGQLELRSKTGRRPKRDYLPPLNFHEIDGNNDQFISEDEMLSALRGRLKKHRRYRYRDGTR